MRLQPTSGSAHVQYRLDLPDSRYLAFDASRVSFEEAQIHDDVYGGGQATHVFTAIDPAFLTALHAGMAGANPVLTFRLGFGPPDNIYWQPVQRHLLTDHFAKYEGKATSAGHRLVLHSANHFARMQRSTQMQARKGKISAIAQNIATAAGLASVVEETDGDFMLVQNFTDDASFLAQRLRPRAINAKGFGDYLCYLRDNVLHFHTLDYQANVQRLDYYSDVGCRFETQDLSQTPDPWRRGVAGASLVTYNPYTGASKIINSDPAKAIKLADDLYAYGNVANGSVNLPYHASYNPPVELNALAQSAYQSARRQVFKTRMVLNNIISLRHGDLLDVLVTQESSRSSPAAGLHLVASSFYEVKKSSVLSVFTLERGELQPQRGSVSAQAGDQQLVPESLAPGQKPNLGALQSSELTRGAGNGAMTSYATVNDPQTG